MFWRFGFHSASAIDGLLDKEGVTLEELLEEEELLQECKAHNSKLLEFLCKPENLQQLLGYITAENLDENKQFKFPYLASEILSCEVFSICDAIMANVSMLDDFWKLLDRPAPLNPLTSSYFSKVNSVLLQKKMPEMIAFVRAQPNVVSRLLNQISSSAIADFLLKLISVEEVPEGNGIVEWLSKEGLVPTLITRLDPNLESEIHNTAAQTLLDVIAVSYSAIGPQEQMIGAGEQPSPLGLGGNALVEELKSEAIMQQLVRQMLQKDAPYAGSTLTNGINIIIELIRRYCSEIEQAEYQQHQFQSLQQQRSGGFPPSDDKLRALATDLNDLLRVIGQRLTQFAELLHAPRNNRSVETTIGTQLPLGSERLKTCELFAEILHLQYLYTSSPLFERLITVRYTDTVQAASSDSEGEHEVKPPRPIASTSVADELVVITDKFIDAKILPVCLDLFFKFPWNNFLHSVVYDMIAKVFNTYSYTSTAVIGKPPSITKTDDDSSEDKDDAPPSPEVASPATPVEEQMVAVKSVVRKLVLSIFKDGVLTKRITAAQRDNDFQESQTHGVRLGFMGHLTYISDEVCKLLEKCSEDLLGEIGDALTAEDWQEYVAGVLRETKERDKQPLGGQRPNTAPQHHMPLTGFNSGFGAADDDTVQSRIESGKRDSDEEDNDLDGGGPTYSSAYVEGDVAGDQFARYLCHQVVADLPDRFIGADGSDDEEEVGADYLGNFDSKDFDVREALDSDNNPFDRKESSLPPTLVEDSLDSSGNHLPTFISEADESLIVDDDFTTDPQIQPVESDSHLSLRRLSANDIPEEDEPLEVERTEGDGADL